MIKISSLFISLNAFSCLCALSEEPPRLDIAMKSFSIEKNFKGFSYIFESPEKSEVVPENGASGLLKL